MDQCAVAYNENFCSDESEMMLQWLGSQSFNQTMPLQPHFLPFHEDSSNNSSPALEFYNADPYNLDESYPINCSFPSLGYETYQHGTECMSEDQQAMSYLDIGLNQQHVSQVFTNEVVETENVVQPKGKRKLEMSCYEKETNDESDETSNNKPRRKSRPSVQAKRRAKSSKEEGSTTESSLCSSDDESNEQLNVNCNSKKRSNGKSKASRGSATDPQSMYAKKRREKINQRLRILQNLVPNGTKVDISTMLEEAVQYVKFLQTQIKLLSSDDLWMYAPVAYNGVNLNIDLSIYQQ